MQQRTISKPAYRYVKLLFVPHSLETPPLDEATLHLLLTRACTEMYGGVGAGAISALGDGVEILSISPADIEASSSEESAGQGRLALLKVANAAITQLLAILPISSAGDDYSIEILGQSPSPFLASMPHPQSRLAGSLDWLQGFTEA